MWIAIVVIYFLVALYMTATIAMSLQYSVQSAIRLGKAYKVIAVLFGFFWVIVVFVMIVSMIKIFLSKDLNHKKVIR